MPIYRNSSCKYWGKEQHALCKIGVAGITESESWSLVGFASLPPQFIQEIIFQFWKSELIRTSQNTGGVYSTLKLVPLRYKYSQKYKYFEQNSVVDTYFLCTKKISEKCSLNAKLNTHFLLKNLRFMAWFSNKYITTECP